MMNQIRCFVGAGYQPARIFLFLFVFLLSAIALRSDTHTAASCSQEHVQAAIDAASDGDTVQVPAGTATWTTVTANEPAVRIGRQIGNGDSATFESKQITLLGAGIGKTIITDNTTRTWRDVALLVLGVEGKTIRISSFTFVVSGTPLNPCGVITIGGTCKNWRIDHCKFDGARYAEGITIAGDTYGIVDHCVFDTGTTPFHYKAFSIYGNGRDAWNKPLSLGTNNAVFVEDCIMNQQMPYPGYRFLDAGEGSRWVFRYNTVYNNGDVGNHGHDSNDVSDLSREVYENKFIHALAGNYYTLLPFRGGTGVIFNNTVTCTVGQWNSFINLYYYCACPCTCPGGECCCPTCSICTSYPCLDQPGRGPDENHDGVQDLQPIYEWGNTGGIIGSHINVFSALCAQVSVYIQKDRDFFVETPRPGYVPYPYPHPLILADYPGQQRSLDLQAGQGGGRVNLSWKAVTGAVNYNILRNWQQVVLVTGTNWSDSAPGSEPVYMVYALDGSGKILAAEGKLLNAFSQTVTLSPGWNWVSFNVLPTDLSLNSVFAGILSKVEQVKTQTQSAIRSNNAWKGDLVNMNGIGQYKMFKVKVTQACTLTVTGIKIAFATAIELKGGWNWVAYLPTTAMPIATALASINGQVQEVKSLTKSATYSGGAWSGTLTQLEPGQGYAIKMSSLWALAYPAGQ
jgi:hypothetical protein